MCSKKKKKFNVCYHGNWKKTNKKPTSCVDVWYYCWTIQLWNPVFIVIIDAPLWWGLVEWCVQRYKWAQFLCCHGNLIIVARFIDPGQFLWTGAQSAALIRYSRSPYPHEGTPSCNYNPYKLALVAGNRMVVTGWLSQVSRSANNNGNQLAFRGSWCFSCSVTKKRPHWLALSRQMVSCPTQITEHRSINI